MIYIQKQNSSSNTNKIGSISNTLDIEDKIITAPSINLVQNLAGIPMEGVIAYEGEEIPEGYEEVEGYEASKSCITSEVIWENSDTSNCPSYITLKYNDYDMIDIYFYNTSTKTMNSCTLYRGSNSTVFCYNDSCSTIYNQEIYYGWNEYDNGIINLYNSLVLNPYTSCYKSYIPIKVIGHWLPNTIRNINQETTCSYYNGDEKTSIDITFINGMTWGEFINSEYNTYNFSITDSRVCIPNSTNTLNLRHNYSIETSSLYISIDEIYDTDYMIPFLQYTYQSFQGGGSN